MLQTTINEIIEQVSKETGEDYDTVNEIVRFQWNKVHESLANFDNLYINLSKFGRFRIKTGKKTMWSYIQKLINTIRKKQRNPGTDFKWENREKSVELYKSDLRNLLKIKNQITNWEINKKHKIKKLDMILIPLEEAFEFNENNKPSVKYNEAIDRYVERAHKSALPHFVKFPEHLTTLKEELIDSFDTCVLQTIFNNEGQYSIEKNVILVDCFRTEDNAIEVGFFVRL